MICSVSHSEEVTETGWNPYARLQSQTPLPLETHSNTRGVMTLTFPERQDRVRGASDALLPMVRNVAGGGGGFSFLFSEEEIGALSGKISS